ncbi:MAG TPA: CsgG/HfaB family protein [bacterium]|nr:CsgG/HfaB family protein [bacterium]
MNKKLFSFFAVAVLLLVSTGFEPLLAKKKMRIAVLELSPVKVAPDLAVGVTDLVVTELVNCGEFEVLERMQVVKILNEQGFQQTGVTDTTKAIEAGKLLNTESVMIGTLQQFNSSLVINVKIVEVSTGKILFADKTVADNNDKLIDASSNLVNSLVGRMTGTTPAKKQVQQPQQQQQTQQNTPPDQLPARVFYAKPAQGHNQGSTQGNTQKGSGQENKKEDKDSKAKRNANESFDELEND